MENEINFNDAVEIKEFFLFGNTFYCVIKEEILIRMQGNIVRIVQSSSLWKTPLQLRYVQYAGLTFSKKVF